MNALFCTCKPCALQAATAVPPGAWTPTRRRLLAGAGGTAALATLALPTPGAAQEAGAEGAPRVALLLGNRDYPPPFDLPPIPKNLRDLGAALQQCGFEVTDALNLSPQASRQALERFAERVARLPDDAIVFFYFSGHGVQVQASDLLLAAGTNPAAGTSVLQENSLQLLRDVIGRLPERRTGMTIAVVDACRTSVNNTPGGNDEGLNQVEAPPNCLISFSTGAGRPAIAPAVETLNTFYTASLVRVMGSLSGDASFSDLFRLVKADVERTMSTHPLEAIRRLTQHPFIAENTRQRVALLPRSRRKTPSEQSAEEREREEAQWLALEAAAWPAEVQRLADAYLKDWPGGRYSASAQVARDGAAEAARMLQRPEVRLYRSAFQPPAQAGADVQRDLRQAGRGDKDAAARLGRRVLAEGHGQPAAEARFEGWLQLAVALGNGIAAYDLALHYRSRGQPLLAAQYEARAKDLGYNPPPTLNNSRK